MKTFNKITCNFEHLQCFHLPNGQNQRSISNQVRTEVVPPSAIGGHLGILRPNGKSLKMMMTKST